jgi:hypothetical protein
VLSLCVSFSKTQTLSYYHAACKGILWFFFVGFLGELADVYIAWLLGMGAGV